MSRVARKVGRYEIIDELGRGGMATVHLARQMDLNRLVALKELNALPGSNPAFARRFLREARLAGSLSHPNIVTVHEYFERDGTPYIAMEYLERGSLRPHVGRLALTQIGGVLEGMLAALSHAERRRVVHRDLKPENVLITSEGRVKITDFGIAKATDEASRGQSLTLAGTAIGTPAYMAPEQAMGKQVGPWSDVYSLGVLAYELFVGQTPFADTEEAVAVMLRQVTDEVPDAMSVNPELDPSIAGWLERLLAKDPTERIRSAGEAWDQFEEIMLALIGPRWRRAARVVADAERPPDVPAGPHTPAPTRAPRPPLMPTLQVPTGPPAEDRTTQMRRSLPTVPAADRRHGRAPSGPGGGRTGVGRAKAVVAIIAVVAAVGSVLGRGGSDAGSPATAPVKTPTRVVRGAAMTLRVPDGWRRLRRAPDLGLHLSGAAAAAPSGRAGGPVVAFGLVKGATAANAALLPAAFVTSTGEAPDAVPARRAVSLSSSHLQAWRYSHLQALGSDRALVAYVVPTTAGVATIACAVPPAQLRAFAAQCDAIAGSARLSKGRPYAVGPSDAYADAVDGALARVKAAEATSGPVLAAARTPAARAGAARELARAYSGAAAPLAQRALSPADRRSNTRLVAALRTVAKGYRSLARAALVGDAAAYRAAGGAITVAIADVTSALAALHAVGYRPPSSLSPNAPAAPQSSTGAPPPAATASPAPVATASPPPAAEEDAAAGEEESAVGDSRSDDPSDDSADP